ncbi:MAG: MFS transporter [Marinilabiliaceae bacterium]|nr:MFS transporter [Marinilabiliaceae bacterium]
MNKLRLFIASCLALLVTSLTFAMRAKIEAVFGSPIADGGFGLSKEEVGWAFSPAFWGFTAAMVIGGLIIDVVKTKTIVWAAFVMHLIGAVAMLLANSKESLFLANVFIGLGNGCVEAALNPMIATIYSKEKTKMLNRFHVWFPGGIVIGGLLAFLMVDTLNISWQVYVGVLFIPLLTYGYLFFGQRIPETERVTNGVSYKAMLKATGAPIILLIATTFMFLLANEIFHLPQSWMYLAAIGVLFVASMFEGKLIHKAALIFPIMFFFMLLTAATELVTNQWMNALLGEAGVNPMLILVVITGLMAVGRFFAGGLVHRFNPSGVLLFSAIFSSIGLYLMSIAQGPIMMMLAAIVFAIGICYFWPTMLGFVSEYIPESGALGMSVLGGAGMVSVAMFLPLMGKVMDTQGTQVAMQSIGILPLILIVGFLFLFFKYRNKKPVELSQHND